jgi:hypothetical protein
MQLDSISKHAGDVPHRLTSSNASDGGAPSDAAWLLELSLRCSMLMLRPHCHPQKCKARQVTTLSPQNSYCVSMHVCVCVCARARACVCVCVCVCVCLNVRAMSPTQSIAFHPPESLRSKSLLPTCAFVCVGGVALEMHYCIESSLNSDCLSSRAPSSLPSINLK